jgi:hypothetical protein
MSRNAYTLADLEARAPRLARQATGSGSRDGLFEVGIISGRHIAALAITLGGR